MIDLILFYIVAAVLGVLLVPPFMGLLYEFVDPLMEKYLDYIDFWIEWFE